MILQYLKVMLKIILVKKVTKNCYHSSAYFNDAQRQATKDAGKIAGLESRTYRQQTTAAATCFTVWIRLIKEEKNLGIHDLGGGTFDVSILELGDGVFDVLKSYGDNKLGGDDFDQKSSTTWLKNSRKENGIDFCQQMRWRFNV